MEKFVNWWKTDKRYFCFLKAALMAALPFLCCVVSCAMQGKTIGQVYLPGSEWNDELFYFKQVESMVEFGYPKGYFGFNESHALKLSYAAWSPVLVFPWIIWGVIFGWNMMSPIICNIVLLTVAMFVFVWLVKPTWKQLGVLALLFCLYTPFVRYMLSGMPEVICFSMLIIFYGIAVSYLKKETVAKIVWLFVISGLLTLMRPYMILFMLLPMFFWARRKKWLGFAGSVVVICTTFGIYAMIKHYFGAEYFAPLFFMDWITAFFEKGFVGGLHNLFSTLYWKGKDFLAHTIQGYRSGLASGAFFGGYLTVMAVLLYQSFADWRKIRREHKAIENSEAEALDISNNGILETGVTNRESKISEIKNQFIVELHLAFSFIGMFFALLLMYKLTEGSKHLLTLIAVGIFVISLMRTKFYKKAVLVGAMFAYLYSYMAIEPYDYQVPFVAEEREIQVEAWREIFAEELIITEVNIPNYDNVIIWVFSDMTPEGSVTNKWQLLYGLPKGFGISCCYSDYILNHFETLQSRYIATVSNGKIDVLCQQYGFREVGRDADMVVFERY